MFMSTLLTIRPRNWQALVRPFSRLCPLQPIRRSFANQSIANRLIAKTLLGMGMFVAALLMLGGWITWREFRRLSVESQARAASRRPGVDPALWMRLPPRDELLRGSPTLLNEAMEGKPSDWMNEERIS